MYRNLGSRFSEAPQANIKRSVFGLKHTHKTTFNAGDLVPIYVQEVLPGDTFDVNLTSLVRLATPLHPTMDNLFLDTYFFYVPNRLIWDNWTKFMGENDKQWAQDTDNFVPPYFTYGGSSSVGVSAGSVLNYLGMPVFTNTSKRSFKATILDFSAYIKIWNDWFRDENLQDECPIYKNDGAVPYSAYWAVYGSFINTYFGVGANEPHVPGSCLKVARFHDYFSSALPGPQKGPDVLIPAGGEVVFNGVGSWTSSTAPTFVNLSGNVVNGDLIESSGAITSGSTPYMAYDPKDTLGLSGLEITVNNLRLAIQTQKLLERDARGGTRYTEIIYSHFGVKSPDARLQRSEYLGGKRTLLNMDEVIQTSETTSASPLGALGGRSVTATNEGGFVKSFTEHGYVIGVCCVRHSRTYSQGLPRRYFRDNRLKYYWSVLANIGEQPIYNKELYLNDSSTASDDNDDVFGYQEAWAEYRYTPDRVSGLFSPDANQSLVSWTYADDYSSRPNLSSQWLAEGTSEIARSLAVQNQPQFIADFYFHGKVVRPMPVYSVPGLVDHH